MQWIPGKVVSRRVWTPGLFTVSVAAPGVQAFEPGQFLQLGFQQSEKHLHRPYSVASPHGEVLDFFIVVVEDGELTPKLWEMEIGADIEVSAKAAGSFTLSHAPFHPHLWLISTGTGLAPYIAMLRMAATWERYQKIVLVHGVRYTQELAYQEELASYREKYGDAFRYVPVVSRCEGEGCLQGRITHCLENGELEKAADCRLEAESSTLFLCGNPDMLNEMEERLSERHILRHKAKAPGNIVVERYW